MSIISCDNQGLNIFINFFTNSCRKCCDPFEIHAKHKIKKSRKESSANAKALIVISSEFAKSH